MANITKAELQLHIKSQSFERVYLLCGEEKFNVEVYSNKMMRSIVKAGFSTFNLQRFDGKDFDLVKFFNAVIAVPFMSQLKCVQVSNIDVDSMREPELKKLKEVLKEIPQSTVVLISQTNVSVNAKKSSKWRTFVKFIESQGKVMEFTKPTQRELSTMLISFAKKSQTELSPSVASKIIDKCGNDVFLLQNEIEKLCAYSKYTEITTDMVDGVTITSMETNVFELVKAITNKNKNLAHKRLDILFRDKEEPIAIVAVLASAYIDMYRVKLAIQAGEKSSVVEQYFDYKGKSFKIDIALRNCREYSLKSIKYCLNEIIQVDCKLKSSQLSKRTLLDKLVVSLCSA